MFRLLLIYLGIQNFYNYFPQLMRFEGSSYYYSDKNPTMIECSKFGVLSQTYFYYAQKKGINADFDKDKKTTCNDIKLMTLGKAQPFYKDMFWDVDKASLIKNPKTAKAIFDLTVNMGFGRNGRHVKNIQKLVGAKQTGIFDLATINKINSDSNSLKKITQYRIHFYNTLAVQPYYKQFLNGWTKRANYFLK